MGEWLESLVPWGTEIIVAVQSTIPEALDPLFLFFTYLGYTEFYLLIFPLIYWCIHKQVAARLAYISFFSAWVNLFVKYLFRIPRPSDPRIRVPLPDTTPSFLSGHAQNAVVNWGYLAYSFRNPIFWAIAIILMISIGLSRIVLGVHFPQDVIAGWLLGLILLVAYIRLEPPVGRWIERQSTILQLVLAVGVPIVLIFLHPAGAEGRYPAADAVTLMAALAGFGVGLIMERGSVRFQVEGEWWRKGLRYLVGIVIVGLFYAGPKLILPEGLAYGLETVLRFVRYALLGWSVTFLSPWLFVRLRLATQAEP
jgi:membrane-associated phospholipid phosphatase